MSTGYVVKYRDTNDTARKHIQTLNKNGKVIWGQWRSGIRLLSEKTRVKMNEQPFFFFAVDSKIAVLKMHCLHVYTREEVIENHLENLIPSYYDINTPCSAYYLIDSIEVLPIDMACNLRNVNTGLLISNAKQIGSPWFVEEINPQDEAVAIIEKEVVIDKVAKQQKEQVTYPHISANGVEDITDYSKTYSIYKYHSKSANKDYIGLTNNVERRRKEHENPTSWNGSKKFLYIFMNIFGLSDFTFEILHSGLSESDAKYWEAKEIQIHNSYYPNGFNERDESYRLITNKPIYID